jgi:hypothetical protein
MAKLGRGEPRHSATAPALISPPESRDASSSGKRGIRWFRKATEGSDARDEGECSPRPSRSATAIARVADRGQLSAMSSKGSGMRSPASAAASAALR